MNITTRILQGRLAALGHHPGPIDGVWGPRTQRARDEAFERYGVSRHEDLFHPSGIHRVHWHWTAGAYGVIGIEHRSYNKLINPDGSCVDGEFPVLAQANYAPGRAASHTRNFNPYAVGISMDCMAGARESPFERGTAPMTWRQVQGMIRETANLCEEFWIPATKFSTLSHAEVQPTFGVAQRFKWDITWLPDMDRPGDPVEVGDRLRAMLLAEMAESGENIDELAPEDA